MSLTIIATNNNITLSLNKETIVVNKEKSKAIFDEIMAKLDKNQEEAITWLTTNFKSIKERIEEKTNGVFSIDNGVIVLKGSKVPVPATIVKKLRELEHANQPILPLIRFWKKLSLNPSENSRRDLFDFMTKNNIPITETGDIVTEKGVNQVKGSYFGHLVDVHSGTVDNSIGMQVVMDRDKVNADSNQTCSSGLHVAAPDYVRKNWTSDVIVECIVNPKDVVSVPKDYNATKMRVCAYYVAGYSQKHNRGGDKVVTLADFINIPTEEAATKMEAKVAVETAPQTTSESTPKKEVKTPVKKVELGNNKDNVKSAKVDKKKPTKVNLEEMSAKQIVDYVREHVGVEITISLKSKKAILKKAQTLLSKPNTELIQEVVEDLKTTPIALEEGNAENIEVIEEVEQIPTQVIEKTVNLSVMSRKELTKFAKDKFNESYSFFTSYDTILEKVTKLAINAGYKIEE